MLVGELMREDHSAIDTLRNHAKTIGGVVGSEFKFFEDRRPLQEKLDEEKMFQDESLLKYYDLRFQQIEKTPLGKQILEQIRRLEEKEKNLKTSISDIRAENRMREQQIYSQAEGEMAQ